MDNLEKEIIELLKKHGYEVDKFFITDDLNINTKSNQDEFNRLSYLELTAFKED
jgi:hypothetical protein